MDTGIEKEVRTRRRRRMLLVLLVGAGVLAGATGLVRRGFRSSVKRSQVTIATVEWGMVDNTIAATGEVLPEFEEILTSPITATIKRALVDAGHPVAAGQSVLELDKGASELDYKKLTIQLESKRNSIHKLKLDLDQSFFELKSNNDIKQLRINSLQAAVENAKRLLQAGGGTREDVEQAELNLQVARLEKEQLEGQIRSKQLTMRADMREAEIAAQVQENDLLVLKRKLHLANLVASRAGIVTWINKNIGATVKEGESLARIADLSSFKVSGSISDNYIGELRREMPVVVKVGEVSLTGKIVNIYPAVQNGIVTFDVTLNGRSDPHLRSNMKVDVYLVTASRGHVLRVANGAAFRGPGRQDVFVVDKGMAVRRRVTVGMTNFDWVELLEHATPGEKIIITDLSEYKNTDVIQIVE
ncbi:MAG TPA: HlyD family efflux transporter periplasmic adaptor subunit [Puia sp.]|nr:HlyD family efflux transporter periplasmic adaptor subunit [Puia sp.]